MQNAYFKKCGIASNIPHVKNVKLSIGFEWGPNTQTKKYPNHCSNILSTPRCSDHFLFLELNL